MTYLTYKANASGLKGKRLFTENQLLSPKGMMKKILVRTDAPKVHNQTTAVSVGGQALMRVSGISTLNKAQSELNDEQ